MLKISKKGLKVKEVDLIKSKRMKSLNYLINLKGFRSEVLKKLINYTCDLE